MSRIIMSIEEGFSGRVIGSFDLSEYAEKIYNQAIDDALRVVEWDGYTLDIRRRIEQLKKNTEPEVEYDNF